MKINDKVIFNGDTYGLRNSMFSLMKRYGIPVSMEETLSKKELEITSITSEGFLHFAGDIYQYDYPARFFIAVEAGEVTL